MLRSYGVANLRNFMRSHVEMTKLFERLVAMDKRFEIVLPRYFAMVCFRISPIAMGRLKAVHESANVDEKKKVQMRLTRSYWSRLICQAMFTGRMQWLGMCMSYGLPSARLLKRNGMLSWLGKWFKTMHLTY
jgi:glutamate/tyrosine decarboxylase-like PLP-dependent enzyme